MLSEVPTRGSTNRRGKRRDGAQTAAAARAWLEDQLREENRATSGSRDGEQRDETSALRVFVWLHLFDPHRPYEPPEPYRGRFVAADSPRVDLKSNRHDREPYESQEIEILTGLYDGTLSYTDALVEGFLGWLSARLPAGEPPLVLVVGDHGEAMGEVDGQLGYLP